MRTCFVAASIACALLSSPVCAGKVFDDLLCYRVVDQRCPDGDSEAMGLAVQGKTIWAALTKETPVGQTFTLGPNVETLWRISTGICHWADSWQPGEDVTFTLWDSPEKRKKLYSRTYDYDHKWHKWDVPFNTRVPAKPGQSFYFELTTNGGGDGKVNVAAIAGDPYKSGQAFVAGNPQDYDLYFVATVKPKCDRVANLKRFLDRFNWDYPPLAEAKKARDKGDLDRACVLILREFETRTQPDSLVPKAVPADKLDSLRVDQMCDEGRLYYHPKERDSWREMSDQTTWNEVWPNQWDPIRQNDLAGELGRAYQTTGNEKYARKLNEVMRNWMLDNNTPYDGGQRIGGIWHAMHQAWRIGDAWGGFGAGCKSKGLTDDVKLGWIDYWRRMARHAQVEPSGGNHANAVGEGLMSFGHRFPEFAQAEEWKRFGFDLLISNSIKLFREDGGCNEPTMNYHGFSLANLLSGIEQAQKYGFKVPEDIMKTVEKALAYTAYMLEPNGQVPSIGDTDCEDFRAGSKLWDGWRKGEAMKAYSMFGRKDCLWIATTGKEGERPKSNSYCFPDTGHYVLRSDFGGEGGKDFEQARWLLLRAGHFGSHGHWDMNEIELYAYGRPLIFDPGRTEYDSPLMPVLSQNTSHNVLLVDDQKMNRKGHKVNAWHTTPVMDIIDTTYEGLYTNVDHRRAVIFVRPDYYVMFDRAVGKEPHRIGINFWLTPPEVTIDRAKASVQTNEPNGSNVLVQALNPEGIEITERKGSLDLGGVRNDIPVVTFWRNGVQEADFATLLYPFPTGAKPGEIKSGMTTMDTGTVCTVSRGPDSDFVFYRPMPGRLVFGTFFAIEGRAGVLRLTGKKLDVAAFALVDGTAFATNNGDLAKSTDPVEELSVRYLPDAVEVTCPKPEPSLEIATMKRTKAIVNGVEKQVSGEMFKPF